MKKVLLQLLVLTGLAIAPILLTAQWSTNPSVNNIICNLSGEQAIPKIATCSNGDTYIGYFSNESGNYNVRLQRLNPQGNIMWAANGILISGHPQNTWLTDWDMTCDGSNYAILAFNDIRNGGNTNVVAYRIAPDGSFAWGADGIALSNSTAFNAAPKVLATAAGNAVFAWQADNVSILQKVSPTGSLLWGTNGITLSGTPRITWPQLLPVGSDEVILKYFEDTGPVNAPTRHVKAQRYNSTGSPVWSSPATVSSAGGISAWTQIFPFINDGSDGFFMTWHDDRDNNQRASTFVQHVNSAGTVVFTANGVEASGLSSMNHYYPQLALPTGSTDVFVYWNEMNGNQDQWGIFGQKISSTGALQWGNNGMTFIAVSGTNVYPVAARKSPTDMVLFYEQYFDAINSSIKAMRISTSGTFVWSPSSVTMCSVNSQKVHPVFNEFANNQWIGAWEDNRSSNVDIYAQNIQLNGTLGPPSQGTISGTISLSGGSGNVTQVAVTAGSTTVYPDATGFYTMPQYPGTYSVTASLSGYYPASQSGVVVVSNQTITVNLTLLPIQAGNIDGHVTLVGGTGIVTLVVVAAGTSTAYPDVNGHYNLSVTPGTYNVIATLPGYYPDTVFGITVANTQTVYNVDLTLNVAPTNGLLQGTVTLNGGSGNVTQADVTAGGVTVHPDATGFYSIDLVAGNYDVTASLTGYISQMVLGVQVLVNQTTPNVNFTLVPEAGAGHIEGHVTLTGGTADVTLTNVSSGAYATHPNAAGFYSLQIPAGTYSVTAANPYTTTQILDNIVVTGGQTTLNIDFLLTVNRADLVCIAYDYLGNYLNDVDLTITGPEGPYVGSIINDSIVFPHVPYGSYDGIAFWGMAFDESDTIIDASNHHLIFDILYFGINEKENPFRLQVNPNPTKETSVVVFELGQKENLTLMISDLSGKFIPVFEKREFIPGTYRFNLGDLFGGQAAADGIYLLNLRSDKVFATIKVVVKR
jgi:hypothetical protein